MTSGTETTRLSPRRMARREAAAVAAPTVDAIDPRPARPARPRWSRRRGVMAGFAAFAALGFVIASVGPVGAALTQASAVTTTVPVTLYATSLHDVQSVDVSADAPAQPVALDRSSYSVYVTPKPTPTPSAAAKKTSTGTASGWTPPFVSPSPGTAQAIAYQMLQSMGMGDDQFACLVALWNKESGWRVNAYNAGSGAYGIPQALPGSKMASAGADWETNPATQISWGLGYVDGRYGTPCGAWAHSQSTGWY